MVPSIGTTYSFTFISKFSSLNGIYRVSDVVEYQTLLDQNIDLYKALYVPLGLDQTIFDTDFSSYRTDQFYKITLAEDSSIIYYVPSSIVDTIPDPNVAKYPLIGIVLKIGALEDESDITIFKDIISAQIAQRLGVTTTPEIVIYDNKYMKIADYETLKAARDTVKTEVVNIYTQNTLLQTEVSRLTSLVAAYEEIITNLQT